MKGFTIPTYLALLVFVAVALIAMHVKMPTFVKTLFTGPARTEIHPDPSTRVWVRLNSGLYYCPNTKPYGTLKPGAYKLETEALEMGYRPALGKACAPEAVRPVK
ncbi:MAG TPA: hypothetical protein VL523_02925 [Terriglobia bacterium]|nr:hypothetical protein [Terriglobia bacterium]